MKDHGVCGLRIQGRIIEMDPVDQPATTPLWKKAADLGITLDVNVSQDEYDAVAWRAREFPDLRIVLDYCGYVSPNLYPPESTVDAVVRLADLSNVYTKLSILGAASGGGFPAQMSIGWYAGSSMLLAPNAVCLARTPPRRRSLGPGPN